MLNVIDNYSNCKYIHSYWYNNIIIDLSKDKLNPDEIEIDSQEESLKKYNAFRDTIIKKSNICEKQDSMKKVYLKGKTSDYSRKDYSKRYSSQDTYSKKYDSPPVKPRVEEYRQGERRILLDSFSKPKLCDLPVKPRIEEYRQGERRILLDSFSKPKLRDY